LRTPDLAGGSKVVSCSGMGDAVCEKLQVMAG